MSGNSGITQTRCARLLRACGHRVRRMLLSVLGLCVPIALFPLPGAAEQLSAWTDFTRENSGLTHNDISALALAPDGSLWVGTEQGLNRLRAGQWTAYDHGAIGLVNRRVRALSHCSDGTLWVGTASGLLRMHGGIWTRYEHGSSDLPDNYVSSLSDCIGGTLWIGSDSGLVRYQRTAQAHDPR
jgi:ligand-binding sensor domain-containing protein